MRLYNAYKYMNDIYELFFVSTLAASPSLTPVLHKMMEGWRVGGSEGRMGRMGGGVDGDG
jgi:hypothetical protein